MAKKDTAPKQPPLIIDNSKVTLKIDQKTAEQAFQNALKKLAKSVKIAGFRKGKAPLGIVEQNIGIDKITDEALKNVLSGVYEQAIKSEKKAPITYPEFKPVSLEKGKAWEIEAHFAEKPVINLKGYEKIANTARKRVEKEIAEQTKSNKKTSSKADKDSKKSKDVHQHEHTHVSPDATKEQKEDHILQHLYQDLVSELKPQIQELLVAQEVRQELENLAQRAQGMNMTLDDFLKKSNMSFEQLTQSLAAQVLGRLQLTFILEAIAEELKLSVTTEEIDAMISKNQDTKVRQKQQSDPQYRRFVEQTLLREKLVDHLMHV